MNAAPTVYEPREDSQLIARAARKHAFGRVLDLGCGTGIIGIAASQNPAVTEIVFADKNPAALECARANAKEGGVEKPLHFVQTDLFSALKNEKFDTICFNPPYLPSDPEDKSPAELKLAWDGGPDGRRVIDPFLERFPLHLNKKGILLFLDCSLNGSEKTEKKLVEKGFEFQVLETQSFFFERLRALKARRSEADL